ncbi:MAG: RluA family pseudouridine synthase [Chloroflexota bacterium]|nr:RluA family pseudouridine synthase [Chloroflexota bacterium]
MPPLKKLQLTVDENSPRLDKYLVQRMEDLSRSYLQGLIKDEMALLNGSPAKASQGLKIGDHITLILPPPIPLIPEDIPVKMVYEDEDLIVVNKPAGLTVHPAPGHPSHTLVNALLSRCPGLATIDSSNRPGIVHRLDKDTSGLMMVAKNAKAQEYLINQMKHHCVQKQYLTMVKGCPSPNHGNIEAPIGRSTRDRKRMAVVSHGRPASTEYEVIEYLGDYALLKVILKTGRTHQIRVHFASRGYPVLGDKIYGVKSPLLQRQFLHSNLLGFKLPSTSQYMEFCTDLPCDLRQVLDHIRDASSTIRSMGRF